MTNGHSPEHDMVQQMMMQMREAIQRRLRDHLSRHRPEVLCKMREGAERPYTDDLVNAIEKVGETNESLANILMFIADLDRGEMISVVEDFVLQCVTYLSRDDVSALAVAVIPRIIPNQPTDTDETVRDSSTDDIEVTQDGAEAFSSMFGDKSFRA